MVDETRHVREQSQFTELDEKLYELQTLFDLSKTLNSSIKNLRTVLDTLLLTSMGKLLISKGVILLNKNSQGFVIETIKGLPQSLRGHAIQIDDCPSSPSFIGKLEPSPWRSFFKKNEVELVIPIYHDDRELGLIGFGKKTLGKEYSDQELDYLYSLSNIAATAIQNGLIFLEKNEVNRQLEKKVQEQNTIFEISQEVNSPPLEIEKVQNLLAYSIMGEMMVKGCLIYLADNGAFRLTMNKGFQQVDAAKFLKNEDLVASLVELKQPVLLNEDSNFRFCAELQDIAVCVLVPMRLQNETKGMIALGEKINKDEFTQGELDFLTTLGNLAINSVENARLFEEEKKRQRLEEELSIARDIQKQLLPESCPNIEGFEVAAVSDSSLYVGGDYYDCIELDDGRYVFCIADVSGKGAPAALLMANLQASLHALLGTNLELPEVTYRINNLIYRNTAYDKFITFFVGVLDPQKKSFQSVNAGHNYPYVFHADGSFGLLKEGGIILGMMPNMQFASESVTLQQGDLVVMFTDGVTEAMNAADEEFEEKRIEACIQNHFDASTEEILESLVAAVKEFAAGQPQADDITILMLKVS